MPFIIADRVRETSTTVGTGNIALGGAVIGYQSFDAVMDTADTTYYVFADQAGGPNWEVGIGTFTAPSTLARTTIISSSNGGSIVNFTAGVKDVFIGLPASKTNVDDQPNVIEVNSSTAALRITQTGAGNALLVEDSANPDATPFVVNASGQVLVGRTTAPFGSTSISIEQSAADTAPGNIDFSKNRAGAVVSSGDGLGRVRFWGYDGASLVNAAEIVSAVDGTPGINDMPGRLVFSTTADGASSPTERMRIDSAGDVGIGTSNPTARLNVVDSTSQDAVRITQTGTGNALVVEDSANPDATPFVIDQTGRVIVGNTASQGQVPMGDGARYVPQTQMQGSAFGTSGLSATLFNAAAASGGGSLALNKSNTSTLGGQAVVASGDVLGTVFFNGSDGTNFVRGAQIQAAVDGTPGTNDMPGRLVFSTTADGASSPTERMRIDASGSVGIGTSNPARRFEVLATGTNIPARLGNSQGNMDIGGSDGGTVDIDTRNWPMALKVGSLERMRIDTSGNVGIGTSSPGARLDVRGSIDAASSATSRVRITMSGGVGSIVSENSGTQFEELRSTGQFASFYTGLFGASERMRITANGFVGIGTSSPGTTLDIYDPASAGNPAVRIRDNVSDLRLYPSGGGSYVATISNTPLIFNTNNTERMRVTEAGNVGIGTSSPGYRLDIPATGAVAANLGGVLVGANGTDITANIAGLAVKVPTANPVQFFTSNLQRMLIDASGNVGVGATTVRAQQHIFGLGQNTAALTDAGDRGGMLRVSGNSTLQGAGGAILFSNVQGDGANSIGFAAIKGFLIDGSNNTAGDLAFSTRGATTNSSLSERMRIDTAGNVGIGTASPARRLDVVGGYIRQQTQSNSITGNHSLLFTNSSNSVDFGTFITHVDNGVEDAQIQIGGSPGATRGLITFNTSTSGAATERARVTPSGEFLVGTSSPAGKIASIGGGIIGVYASSTGNHAVFGDGTTTGFYGVYGASTNTSYGGVIGYHNSYNAFGILGYVGYGLYTNASIWVNGTVYTSDARLKENVAPLEGSLAKVAALNPVSFDWKANSFRGASGDFGLIAQEVEQVIPECVFETAVPKRTPEMKHAPTLEEELGTYKGVDYSRFIPLLIAAVKELSAENNTLKARVAALENR